MDQVSRPLLGVLLATLAVGALWFTMLKPGGPEGAPSTQGTTAYQSDIAKAKQAVATAGRASAAQGGGATGTPTGSSAAGPTHTLASSPPSHTSDPPTATATKPSASAPSATKPAATKPAATKPAASKPADPKPAATQPAVKVAGAPKATRHRLDKVSAAIADHKVVALLFYNPAGADDQAVKQELASVPSDRGRVVKLAVPIGELAHYPVITTQVPVTESPTLVLIDRQRQATTVVGFASGFEITQLVDAAAAVK